MRNNINFGIVDMCYYIGIDNEATILKNSQYPVNISTTYILPASTINTTILNNIKKVCGYYNHSWRSYHKAY